MSIRRNRSSSEVLIPKIREFTTWATGRCQLACKYCFVFKMYPDQPSSDFRMDLIDPLISLALTQAKPCSIWWFGGEPLVAFDVVKEAVEVCKRRNVVVGRKTGSDITFGMTTNMVGLTESIAKFMKMNEFGILCSIDGLQGSHDMYRILRNGSGTWEMCWNNLKLVRKYLNRNPQIRWSYTPDTISGLADAVKWYVKNGLLNLAIEPVYEVEWSHDDILKLREEITKIRGYVIEWYRQGIPLYLKPVRDGISQFISNQRGWESRCGLGQGSVGVDVNGDIYNCHRFVASRKFKIGNVATGLDNNARMKWIKEWRKHVPVCEDMDECITCPYRSACMGGCLAVNYDMFGDTHVCPNSYCEIHKMLCEIFTPMYKLLEAEGNNLFFKTYRKVNS